jgi:hypothetical protein
VSDETPEPAGESDATTGATDGATDGARYGRVRRAPRYGSFVVTGVLVGVVIAVILSFSRPSTGQFSSNSVVGYVAAIFGLLGALIGAAFAVVLDRRHSTTDASELTDSFARRNRRAAGRANEAGPERKPR